MLSLTVRTYTVSANGTELGTFAVPSELADAIVGHFGKGYRHLADVLADAIDKGKDTEFIERVLGVHVTSEYATIAA